MKCNQQFVLLWIISKKSLPNPRSWRFLLLFSSRSVTVLGFMFRYVIHLNIYIRCKVGSGSLFLIWISNYFSIVFWKDYFPWVAFACLSKISCLFSIPLTDLSILLPTYHRGTRTRNTIQWTLTNSTFIG